MNKRQEQELLDRLQRMASFYPFPSGYYPHRRQLQPQYTVSVLQQQQKLFENIVIKKRLTIYLEFWSCLLTCNYGREVRVETLCTECDKYYLINNARFIEPLNGIVYRRIRCESCKHTFPIEQLKTITQMHLIKDSDTYTEIITRRVEFISTFFHLENKISMGRLDKLGAHTS